MGTQPDRVDKYELQQSLGKNSISEAWKAFDNQARRYVAIKLYHAQLKADPDFASRFQQEAQAIVALRHPNIVPCYDFSITQFPETESATAYLVMEYLEGGTLADYNRNASQTGKLLSIPAIVHLFSSIGMAIDFAHRQHVVHGNLKPTNILLDKQNTASSPIGEPMVSDFNTAKLMGPTGSNAGALWNSSPFYVSPEQVMGTPANELSDIYSLGIMLYEICTGTVPFLGNSAESIMMQQVNTVPASPSLINPSLPPALSTVVMRCIAKDPKARFPSVLALVAALTNVEGQSPVNVSHPENVGQFSGSFATQERDMPTVISAKMSPLPAGLVASGPMYASNAQMGGISQPYVSTQWADKSAVGAINRPLPTNTPVGVSMPPPTAPASKKPRRRGLVIALLVILLLAVIGSALGAYFTFFAKGTTTTTATTTIPQTFGHAYFVSSGFVSPDSRQGITDELQINLVNASPAPSGKSYYAWLLNDKTLDWKPIYLGQLAYNSGTLNLFYHGDAVHSNLLATNSRFLVTEEDASTTPTSPSLDPHAWVYYAEFSQIKPVPTDPTSYSLYDHIRHLLSDDPKVKAAGLTGGLDIWLYRDTQKILEWAGSARDAWKYKSVDFIHRQLIRMMDYLDGTLYAQKDIPGQNILADPNISKIGLLTMDPLTQNPPGYLYHIGKHLHEITALPQTSAAQKALAIQINQEIDVVNLWMRSIKTDVLQLYAMNDTQLTGQAGRILLDEVATLANDAFVGKVNSNAQVTAGVVQIHYAIQQLATFDLRACMASDPCTVS
ncbi:MAG: protein kinase domain-containing protein [Ktedonobacteraceae bacterium]